MSTLAGGPRGLNHLPRGHGYGGTNAMNGVHRHPAHPSYHQHQQQDSSQASSPLTSSGPTSADSNSNILRMEPGEGRQLRSSGRKQPKKGPDWAAFYKNGLPKEVIVIPDDSPEPPIAPAPAAATTSGRKRKYDDTTSQASYKGGGGTLVNEALRKQSQSTVDSYRIAATERDTLPAPSVAGMTDDSSVRAGPKRRRVAAKSGVTGGDTKRRDTKPSRVGQAEYGAALQEEYKGLGKKPTKASPVTVRVVRDDPNRDKKVKIDDDDGHYIVVPDMVLANQYRITKLLGQGTFGKVVQAVDRRTNQKVAVKVIRAVQKYRDAAKIELRALRTLRNHDLENKYKCIHLRDCFDFRGHICIVTDLLDLSLFDFLKANTFVPFPNSHIQSFARQLLTSVAFLHDLNLIHTDLKPENILLCDSQYQTFTYNRRIPSSQVSQSRQSAQRKVLLNPEIRLIDFGSATFEDEYHSSVVSTRHYRAPEIILGLGWSYPCDIWSIGCILVEFFTGDALFQTHDNLEHLAMIEAVLDRRIDVHLIKQIQQVSGRGGGANSAAKYFKRWKLDYPTADSTRASRRFVKQMKRLVDIIPAENSTFLANFLDLLQKIFVYDPEARITAQAALQHPWFRESHKDDGTEAAKIRHDRNALATRSEPGSVSGDFG